MREISSIFKFCQLQLEKLGCFAQTISPHVWVHKILCSSSLDSTFQIEISVIRIIFVILSTFLQWNIVKKFPGVSQHSSKPLVRAPLFLWFLNLFICSKHQDQVCSKETKLRSSNQETFPLVVKNNREVLVPCLPWKCVPTAISGVASGEFLRRVTEIASMMNVSLTRSLFFWFLPYI